MKRFLLILYILSLGIGMYCHPANGNTISSDSQGDSLFLDYQRIVHKIFKEDELFILFYMDAALIVDPTQDSQIVKLVDAVNPWKDVKEFLYGKSNIYFCPSDQQIGKAIEYMNCPIDTALLMSDKFGMYRLSSPEELFKNRGDSFRQSNHKAIVFGGLQYDRALEEGDNLLAFRGQEPTREQGLQYTPLKSSYFEAIYVDSVMRKNGMEVALITGENGSEAAFYQIPGKNVDILHIASHAYYAPEIDNNASRSLQEWMLSHTGLVLSGANSGCNFTKDDGHLTAYEISQTDLSSVKLAILSGCETGQGDIQENDVYGLLKGMKLAGAGTVMVSLSKVYDSATSILMNRFYDNIFRGDNPRRALENSQRFLRLYDKGQYNDPRFWARFILVDDLDRNIGLSITVIEKNYFLDHIIGMKEIYSMNDILPKIEMSRKKLNRNEVFIRLYGYSCNKHYKYVAFLVDPLKPDGTIIPLFQPDSLYNNVPNNSKPEVFFSNVKTILDYVNTETLDSILWQPLRCHIEGKTTIYIQAMGPFEDYPIELMPSLSDRHIYRVSSIDTFNRQEPLPSKEKQIWLYGGLNYDLEQEWLLKDDKSLDLTRGIDYNLPYLSGTKQEADSIAKSCKIASWPYMMFSGDIGTEASFRSIEHNPVGTIHLSTHGFSLEEETTPYKLIMQNNPQVRSLKDYLLSSGCLCFAGANSALIGKKQISNTNDGILLGSDIYKMNLKNIDLVVLSTCSVLRGQQHYDRTWNLITAFKLAGVKSIMFSLWNVSDEATASLMAEFYKNWISGMNKNVALEEAKRYIRSFEKWKDPKYWASFVLLDSTE